MGWEFPALSRSSVNDSRTIGMTSMTTLTRFLQQSAWLALLLTLLLPQTALGGA